VGVPGRFSGPPLLPPRSRTRIELVGRPFARAAHNSASGVLFLQSGFFFRLWTSWGLITARQKANKRFFCLFFTEFRHFMAFLSRWPVPVGALA
jgi:hypothetical protein